jgi:hypothetical protein
VTRREPTRTFPPGNAYHSPPRFAGAAFFICQPTHLMVLAAGHRPAYVCGKTQRRSLHDIGPPRDVNRPVLLPSFTCAAKDGGP